MAAFPIYWGLILYSCLKKLFWLFFKRTDQSHRFIISIPRIPVINQPDLSCPEKRCFLFNVFQGKTDSLDFFAMLRGWEDARK